MQGTTKKKPNLLLIGIGFIGAIYLGYLFGGAAEEGADIIVFYTNFVKVSERPFANY